jgi:hypothetical protein
MTADTTTSTEPDHTDDNIVYVVIHSGTSLENYSELADPESVESEIARARGKAEVIDTETIDDEENSRIDRIHTVEIQEGPIRSETGYFMCFAKKRHLHLDAATVANLNTIQNYPLPESAYSSLPPRLQAQLKDSGAIKIKAGYDYDLSQFFGVEQGWRVDEVDMDVMDRLAELIENVGAEQAAIDYLYVEEGPEEWDEEVVARVRGVSKNAVQENIRRVENRMNP